jgi:pyrimidine deaminase RibD-like protein
LLLFQIIAAAVVDPKGRVVKAVNYLDNDTDKRVHGERAAIEAYERKYGRVTPDCTIVTTLSPCSERMDDRYGESCEDLLDDYGITDIYCGYQDPTQDSGYTVTDNEKIQELCKAFADTFLGDQQLDELSFLGSPCTKDCSGHRAGYAWSQSKGGRVAQSPWSPSFNNGSQLHVDGK